MGFYMGKFIYLMDAYEDIGKDNKYNCYNVLNLMHKETEQDFETFSGLLLTSMMSECAKSFERLPILLHAEICRNILYSGVWTKYEYLRLKKQTKQSKDEKKEKKEKEKREKKEREKKEKEKKIREKTKEKKETKQKGTEQKI